MFNTNNDFTKLTRAFYSFVEDKPYLFQYKGGMVTISDYLDFIHRDLGQRDLKCFYIPVAYSLDVLDQFKDNIVCTSYTANQMGRQFYSIIQVNEGTHILAAYSLDDDKFAVILDFMVADAAFFTEFLKKNKHFAMHPIDSQPLGFNN